jgi:hypothetical protein
LARPACAAFIGAKRRAFYNRLKEEYLNAGAAYGYAAESARIGNGLEKDRAADARCAGGNPRSIPLDAIYTAFHQMFLFWSLIIH